MINKIAISLIVVISGLSFAVGLDPHEISGVSIEDFSSQVVPTDPRSPWADNHIEYILDGSGLTESDGTYTTAAGAGHAWNSDGFDELAASQWIIFDL